MIMHRFELFAFDRLSDFAVMLVNLRDDAFSRVGNFGGVSAFVFALLVFLVLGRERRHGGES